MKPQRTQLRIVAGQLRGRRIDCVVTDDLRPTPQMVREAFFSILGDAIPDRPFFDIFAGTGVIGLEAISRGAGRTVFIERDQRLAGQIEQYQKRFGVEDRGQVLRADVYRWAERWLPPQDVGVNLFLSPPFADLQHRFESFWGLVAVLQEKAPPGSILTVQVEDDFDALRLPDAANWERRQYGRNLLLIWIRFRPAA